MELIRNTAVHIRLLKSTITFAISKPCSSLETLLAIVIFNPEWLEIWGAYYNNPNYSLCWERLYVGEQR